MDSRATADSPILMKAYLSLDETKCFHGSRGLQRFTYLAILILHTWSHTPLKFRLQCVLTSTGTLTTTFALHVIDEICEWKALNKPHTVGSNESSPWAR